MGSNCTSTKPVINYEFNSQIQETWSQILNENNQIYSNIFTKHRDSTFRPLLSFNNVENMDRAREEFVHGLQCCNQLCKSFNTEQINNIMDRIKMDTKFSKEEIREIITQILRE